MSHKNNFSNTKEQVPEGSSVQVRVLEGDSGLAEAVDSVGESVSEVASGQSEKKRDSSSQSKQSAKTTKKGALLDEKLLLRERLLASAPKVPAMRQEVKKVLEARKIKVEKEIRTLRRSKQYDLLSQAIAELRRLVRQIELVAHASYELLKEIWLKVVHRFA
ncbi:hypothetical protein IPG41_00620 [Candidatus Peregrinibacteria bacterium]|nr:MAG: hypothetical protein IPG41_00620 [Candidatus Peregrinibacteria bacterium]